MLAIGWRPGAAELDAACCIEHWAILPGSANRPYQIMGVSSSLPLRRSIIIASVITIDPSAHWARVWDEWAVIGDGLDGAATFDPAEIQRAGADWLLAELARLMPAH
jgi:hypothetical protein